MAELVKVRLQNGADLFVEIDQPENLSRRGVSLGVVPDEVDLQRGFASVKQAASELFEALQSMEVRPSECEICFGLKLSGSVGAILAHASGEANFTVKMTWSGLNEAIKGE